MNLRPLLLGSMASVLLAAALPRAAGGAAADQPSAAGRAAGPLRFLRVFALADRVENWPLGEAKYLRMEPAEFERLLRIAQSTASASRAPMAARIVSAQYEARLVGDRFAAGQCTMQVIPSAEAHTLLPLSPCGLAIAKAEWAGQQPSHRGDLEDAAANGRATIGLGADGELQVLVEDAGQLGFDWSLAGQRDAEDVLNFQFELPACPTNRLVLELPANLRPVTDRGEVSEIRWIDERLRLWEIELGGHHRFRLRLLPTGPAGKQRRLPLVQESLEYHFSLRGLDVVAELKFEIHNGPLRQVTLALDRRLQLVSARCSGTTVPWLPISANGGSASRVVLTLPEPVNDTPCVLQLRALAPLDLDRRWQLPRIRAEGVFWQEGTAALLVPAPLLLKRLLPVGCRQTGAGPLSGSSEGESAQFRYSTPDATVEVMLSRRRAPLKVAGGTSIELSDRGMTARVVADFRIGEAQRFLLEADVSRRWLIDSVESYPPQAMDDWELGNPSGRRRRLSVRLAKSLSPTRPMRLVVNLHSRLGRNLGGYALLPLHFLGAEDGRPLVAVRAVGPFQLRLTGAEDLKRIDPHTLDAAQRELFAELPQELLFEIDPGADQLEISLASRRPGYAARLSVEAIVGEETLRESYTLRCVPESARVDRLVVYFSHRRDQPPRWTLGAQGDQQLSARPLSAEEQARAGLAPGQEAWELTLRRPRSQAFEVRGTREVRLQNQQPISLISLPEATSQRATLVVRSPGWEGLRIENRRLTPIPAETVSPGRHQTARATYRFDPSSDVIRPSEPAITVSRSGHPTTPPAWVWSCRLRSRFETNGRGQHQATYRLQNSGSRTLELDLPSGVKPENVHGVWVDAARVAPHRLTIGPAGRLAIDLPPGEKFPCVSIYFSTPAARLGTIGSLSVPMPKTDLKVLAQDWTVWLPPGYEALDPDLARQSSATSRLSWSRRLFGPLGRAGDQGTFDPLGAIARIFARGGTPRRAPAALGPRQGQPAEMGLPWTEADLTGGRPSVGHSDTPPRHRGGTRTPSGMAGWADSPGWNTYCLEVPGTTAVRLKYVHRQTIRLLGSVAFLLVIALGWWMAGDRPGVLSLLAGGFGCGALLLPEAYVPIASGGVLGALFCLVYRLIRSRSGPRQIPADSRVEPDPAGLVSAATLAGILVFAAAVVGMVCAVARGDQQPEPALPQPAHPVHRVFIPIDRNKQPTGDKYYVPEEVYDQLHRLETAATKKPHGWLIKRADYRGVLSRETTSQKLVVEELKASFALEVFDPAARVRIPLGREGANLLPDGALLDSRVIQPEWEADGSGLLLDVPQPGKYRLELSLRPTLRSDGLPSVGHENALPNGWAGFDLSIPPLANSRLELSIPPGATSVEVPSAIGLVRLADQPPQMVADLGPSNRLTVRWPDGTGRKATGSTLDVEELLWMKIQPGSVVVDAKFKFKIARGQLREVRLAADGRLRLRPLDGDNPPEVEVRKVPGQPQILVFRWPKPVSEGVVLSARFDLTGTWGVGNLRLPQLKALDAKSIRRWLAVSVDPALEHEAQVPDRHPAVAVPDFLSSWGQPESQPLFACRLSPGDTSWSLSTRLSEPRTSVEQKLALSFDRESIAVQFDAQLVPSAGYIFQHRLLAPAALKVQDVSVLEEGKPRAARWSQDGQGTVTVFLTELMAGPQKLSLRGSLPIRGRKIPLPVLRIDQGQMQSSTIELFRRPAVLVKLDQADGLVPLDDHLSGAHDPQWGRPVGRFRARSEGPIKATLLLTPNHPTVRAEQVTRLRCRGGAWKAEIVCRLHVTGGVVDQIRVEVPGPLGDSFEVSPQAATDLIETPGRPRQLIVRPAAAIDADYRFTISSPLTLAPGDRPGAPQVSLRQVDELKRFLALPKQADGQPIGWETRGLKETPLPDGFVTPPDTQTLSTYEIVGRAYRAVLGQDRSRQRARVRLADVQLVWQADRSCVGVVAFDLVPGRLPECRLWLPSEYRLLQVSVAGVPTEPVPSEPVSTHTRAWRVPLGPARLPQRIEVLFSGNLSRSASAAGRIFEAPTLGKLPVERTLWTIVGPSRFEPGRPDDDSLASQLPHELVRLTSAAAMIESGSTVPAEDPHETLRWYRRWARRLAAARTALGRRPASGGSAQRAREEIAAIDARQSQIAQRLGLTTEYGRLTRSGRAVADDPAEIWQASLDRPLATTRCTLPKRSGSITLSYRRAETPGLPYRLAGATGLVAVTALLGLGLRRGTLTEWFKRWPHVIGVAIGLAWWLWLWPSILGWGIVLASLAAALLSGWKYAAAAPGSSIISLHTRRR